MLTEKETSLGYKSVATDKLITVNVAVCLRHSQSYERNWRQGLYEYFQKTLQL